MIRLQCSLCQKDKFVAYSCKGRTICPRCNGRSMADTAKHLVENVIPNNPVRQWVLSMPYDYRFILSSDSKLLSSILKLYHRVISRHYLQKAKQKNLTDPKVGAVTVIQRFGGALNLNIHFHTLYIDGVFSNYKNSDGDIEQRFTELIPTHSEVMELTKTLHHRIKRAFIRAGYFEDEVHTNNEIQLSLIKSQSVTNTVDNFQKPEPIGKFWNPPFIEFSGEKCFNDEGFSLHANTKIKKDNRDGLEKLCRYIARGAISKERISLTANGMVILKLKSQYTDGTTHLKFTPEQFIKRLISLIPPPRANMIRYHGFFAPRHRNRSEITSQSKGNRNKDKKKTKKKKKTYRTPWAELLKHTFKEEVDLCDQCGTKLQLIASITSPIACRRILEHLKLNSAFVEATPARAPPVEDEFALDLDEFDQSLCW